MEKLLIILFFIGININAQYINSNDIFTGEPITFEEIKEIPKEFTADNIIFKKSNGKFFKRVFYGPLNTRWFGAKGDGYTDDSDAIQKTVDIATTLNLDVDIFQKSLITKSIYIDRLVDDLKYDNYFKIMSSSGGGIIVNSEIPIFSSRIKSDGKPVSQMIVFQGVNFETKINTLNSYVLDGSKFLRTQFKNCSFSKIKLLSTTKNYIQSIYLYDCNVRRFKGSFIKSGNVTFDLKIHGCIIESAEGIALEINNPQGVSIIGNTIEGMSVAAIKYGGSKGLSIIGNYFEENGKDIDGRSTGGVSQGVALIGNFFFHKDENDFSVLWGKTNGCVSLGNWHNGSMHFLTSAEGIITNDSAAKKLANIGIVNVDIISLQQLNKYK